MYVITVVKEEIIALPHHDQRFLADSMSRLIEVPRTGSGMK